MVKTILVVAAHPDDEVIGCGGTIARHSKDGDNVYILIVAEGETSRQHKEAQVKTKDKLSILSRSSKKAAEILGAKKQIMLNLPDNRLDSIDRLDLIKIIEQQIEEIKPEIIYVHHGGDLNIDHRRIFEAVATACRPTPNNIIKRILSYEVASSTEWQLDRSKGIFIPNWYVDISNNMMSKIKALEAYEVEMREWPHARSIKAIEHNTRLRGAQVGLQAAEAFCLLRNIE